jgi:DNA-binding IclR family transcriptional regulator
MNTTQTTVHDQNAAESRVAALNGDQATLLSVDKALLVVELLLRDPDPLSARAIAEQLGINRTTTHRLLNALMFRGWIEKPTGTASYRLSLKFLALAHTATQARNFLEEVRPTLDHLSRLSRETAHLGVLDGFEVIHIDKIDSPERVGISSKTGSRATPHLTGLGKALLAASPDSLVDHYVQHVTSHAFNDRLVDPAAFYAELELTRRRGYSIDNEEDSIGVRCLGVAIRGAGGTPLFAMSLTGPSPRFTLDRVEALAPEIVEIAEALSRQFGWDPE